MAALTSRLVLLMIVVVALVFVLRWVYVTLLPMMPLLAVIVALLFVGWLVVASRRRRW